MDALVAEKIMGLKKVHMYCGELIYDVDFPLPFMGAPIVEHYSGSISASWKMVEKIRKHYRFIHIFTDNKEGDWHCHINPKTEQTPFVAIAKTAPLAICRAALLALGLSVDFE